MRYAFSLLTRRLVLPAIFLFAYSFAFAQQMPDTAYTPPSFTPRYAAGNGPEIFIDREHNNFHTAKGRYAPFTKVLTMDGYEVKRGADIFTTESLKGKKIMVIANAVNSANLAKWELPTPSAFTEEEIKVMNEWVKNGGSLFLIADHMPFAGAATDLAKSFGFTFYNGFAFDNASTHLEYDLFRKRDNTLLNLDSIGLHDVENIATFMGQGFDIPPAAIPILILNNNYEIREPQVAWKFTADTKRMKGGGKAQGAIMRYGKGRVVIFGEAAMFSAQIANGQKAGMNTSEGANNYRLLLALIHWLDY